MNAALYGLDAPDELTDLNLKDLDRKKAVKALYETFIKITTDLRYNEMDKQSDGHHIDIGEFYCRVSDALYKAAANIVRPFHNKFEGTFNTRDFPWHGFYEERHIVAPFLSALLNETDTEMLLITGTPLGIEELDKCPKNGKIVNVAAGEKVHFLCGDRKYDGIIINHGEVGGMGVGTIGGLYINYGKVNDFGSESKKGVFVTMTEPSLMGSYDVKLDELAKDKKLSALMGSMEKASKGCDIPKIKKLARKIDAHVRKNYKRQVA